MVSPREAIIRNGLPPALVDDPLFRKALVTTSRMGQTAVCMGKGNALGKRDTTLPHRQTFTRKIIPQTDKRLDAENMERLKPKMNKIGGTIMSDGWQSTCSRALSCFCNGQTILSEGHGWGRQEGYLVSDGGFL
jgi:hypothetical protein